MSRIEVVRKAMQAAVAAISPRGSVPHIAQFDSILSKAVEELTVLGISGFEPSEQERRVLEALRERDDQRERARVAEAEVTRLSELRSHDAKLIEDLGIARTKLLEDLDIARAELTRARESYKQLVNGLYEVVDPLTHDGDDLLARVRWLANEHVEVCKVAKERLARLNELDVEVNRLTLECSQAMADLQLAREKTAIAREETTRLRGEADGFSDTLKGLDILATRYKTFGDTCLEALKLVTAQPRPVTPPQELLHATLRAAMEWAVEFLEKRGYLTKLVGGRGQLLDDLKLNVVKEVRP